MSVKLENNKKKLLKTGLYTLSMSRLTRFYYKVIIISELTFMVYCMLFFIYVLLILNTKLIMHNKAIKWL